MGFDVLLMFWLLCCAMLCAVLGCAIMLSSPMVCCAVLAGTAPASLHGLWLIHQPTQQL